MWDTLNDGNLRRQQFGRCWVGHENITQLDQFAQPAV